MTPTFDRKSILNRLIAPGVKQEAFDAFVGSAIAIGAMVIAIACAVWLFIDIARHGGV